MKDPNLSIIHTTGRYVWNEEYEEWPKPSVMCAVWVGAISICAGAWAALFWIVSFAWGLSWLR